MQPRLLCSSVATKKVMNLHATLGSTITGKSGDPAIPGIGDQAALYELSPRGEFREA